MADDEVSLPSAPSTSVPTLPSSEADTDDDPLLLPVSAPLGRGRPSGSMGGRGCPSGSRGGRPSGSTGGRPSGSARGRGSGSAGGRPSGSGTRLYQPTGGSADLPDCCCASNCVSTFNDDPILSERLVQWHHERRTLGRENYTATLFRLFADMRRASRLSQGTATTRWTATFLGREVCMKAMKCFLGIGSSRLGRLCLAAEKGVAPVDLRTAVKRVRPRPAVDNADRFLSWLYENVAEDMPFTRESTVEVEAEIDFLRLGPQLLDGTTEWLQDPAGPCASGAALAAGGVRYLPPQSLVEIYDFYCLVEKPHASYDSFLRCFRARWKDRLRIRNAKSTQSKCPECERYKELRRSVVSPTDVAKVVESYRTHLQAQYEDRAIDSRISAMAAQAARGVVRDQVSIMSCCLDGMDQSKFRVPRNLSLSKEFQHALRADLHCTGAIAHGIFEGFFLSDCRLRKDSNLQLTVLSRVLELSHTFLSAQADSGAWPSMLRCHTDNATSEGKNQHVMKYMAWMVFREAFKSAEMSMFRVGHTHNELDQRFSEVATALSRSQRLEEALC